MTTLGRMAYETTAPYAPLPRNSEDFLPPAHTKHKDGDEAFAQAQNADRERQVCAVGLDVHYELNVVAEEAGSFQPRLKPFNPRMSGPACPPNYTGKFVDPAKLAMLRDDPIAAGREVERARPYDEPLYRKYDPRLVSKTVVVRDYGCKLPIDPAGGSAEQLAKAVLNHYPDQYVAFLGTFVSALFGAEMRGYLEVQRAGLRRLLEEQTEINKISWGAYRSVQGGVDVQSAADEAAKNDADSTLPWTKGMDETLNKLASDGRAMTGQCSSQDVYDLRPCLEQHIGTLTEMIDVWCRGFGAKERYVLAMLWWCNEQGRNLCADLQLLDDAAQPDYDRVRLHVPFNFYQLHTPGSDNAEPVTNPDRDTFVREGLTKAAATVASTTSKVYSVGAWSGNQDVINNFLGIGARAPYHYGWGHVANLAVYHATYIPDPADPTKDKQVPLLTAPFLKYDATNNVGTAAAPNPTNTISLDNKVETAYVDGDRWGSPFLDATPSIFTDPSLPARVSVRDTLEIPHDAPPAAFRGATYRSVSNAGAGWTFDDASSLGGADKNLNANPPASGAAQEIEPRKPFAPSPCPDADLSILLDPAPGCGAAPYDPMHAHRGTCLKIDHNGRVAVSTRAIGPYLIADLARNEHFMAVLGDDTKMKLKITRDRFLVYYEGMPVWPTRFIAGARAGPAANVTAREAARGQVGFVDYSAIGFDWTKDEHTDVHFSNMTFDRPGDLRALQLYALYQFVEATFGFFVAAWLFNDDVDPTKAILKDTLNKALTRLEILYKYCVNEHDERGKLPSGKPKLMGYPTTAIPTGTPYRLKGDALLKQNDDTVLTFPREFATAELTPAFVDKLDSATYADAGVDAFKFASTVGAMKTVLKRMGKLEANATINAADVDADVAKVFDRDGKSKTALALLMRAFLAITKPEYDDVERRYGSVGTGAVNAPADNAALGSTEISGPGAADPKAATFPASKDTLTSTKPIIVGGEARTAKVGTTKINRFTLLAIKDSDAGFNTASGAGNNAMYNVNPARPQLFAMLDACGLLWNARAYKNPADGPRPAYSEQTVDGMHYWCRNLAESFVAARQLYVAKGTSASWESDVKMKPHAAFPATLIGAMSDDSFRRHFPLLPVRHALRDDLRKARALEVLWGALPSYQASNNSGSSPGAWMPLSAAHQARLYKAVGLFDDAYRVPRNPWCAHDGRGVSKVFNQSYHSVYHCDSYQARHFQSWLATACKYQPPGLGECVYPFSQYGGTPVEADFVHHMVAKPKDEVAARHRELVYNRFGNTRPLRLGQQYHDAGLLQDLYSYSYRTFADLSREQRAMKDATEVWPSNFLAYARNHAILALASCNQGTEEMAQTLAVRNLYRLHVDTYECMGRRPDDDGVPAVLGFLPTPVNRKEDRPVVLFAGSLSCLNTKLERFCHGPGNRGEKVCALYKQVYLNDATLLFTRMLKQRYRELLHGVNFQRARAKRGMGYTRPEFNRDLIELQDTYIDFLQQTVLGLLLESGADLNGAPLHLLEPRELEVSLLEEDDGLVGTDYLTPRTQELLKGMDFAGEANLTRTQLAILSLIPPNNRILGTLRLQPGGPTEVVDLEHVRKQIQNETAASNKKVWQRYSEALISAAFAQKLLEVDGPIDFSFDLSAIQDPIKAADAVPRRMAVTTPAAASSSLATGRRAGALRSEGGPDSVMALNKQQFDKALDVVRDRVEADYRKFQGGVPRAKVLHMLKVPEHIKRILNSEMQRLDAM